MTASPLRAGLLAASLSLGLMGCSVSSPLAVESTRAPDSARPQQVALIPAGDDENAQRRTFRTHLGEVFSSRGISANSDARLVADFAISSGPAEFGVQKVPASDGAEADLPEWIDAPRESRRFDKCAAQELRGTIVLTDRTTGEVVYRGRGMATECGFDDAAIRSLAEVLVEDFLAAS